jgi:hypothetical protein
LKFTRVWAMPSADTFSVQPIRDFVMRYVTEDSCDPFARNSEIAKDTNDLNPETKAKHHMEAQSFLTMVADEGRRYRSVLFDPPYSPRQISEVYQAVGLKVGMEETQSARLYSRCRDQIARLVPVGGHVLSFGWNTVGMGLERGFELVEVLLVCHGGAHNDTICIAERRVVDQMSLVVLHETYVNCSIRRRV